MIEIKNQKNYVSNSGSSNNPGYDLKHSIHLSTSIFASIS